MSEPGIPETKTNNQNKQHRRDDLASFSWMQPTFSKSAAQSTNTFSLQMWQELNVSYIALFYSTEEQILLQERNNQTQIFLLFDLLSAIFEV